LGHFRARRLCIGRGGPTTQRRRRRRGVLPVNRRVRSVDQQAGLVVFAREAVGDSAQRRTVGRVVPMGSDALATPGPARSAEGRSVPRRRVFLVHGRDMAARGALAALLRAFDLRVIGWEEAAAATGQATPYTGDVVAAGMLLADAVVVLLTPDDLGYVQPRFRLAGDGHQELEPTGQPRLNVVFEAGMAMARDRNKVVLVEVGQVRPMSDTAGLNVVRLSNDAATRRQLGARLRTAGLDVDMDHDEFRDAGDFDRQPRAGQRRASIPERLVAHHVLADGQELTIVVPGWSRRRPRSDHRMAGWRSVPPAGPVAQRPRTRQSP
jgi:predicted nucleotide-binding protein